MIKRISLLITAALLVATMAVAGLAGPAFAQPNQAAGFKTQNPGGQEQGCGGNNPNCETTNRGGNAPPGQQ